MRVFVLCLSVKGLERMTWINVCVGGDYRPETGEIETGALSYYKYKDRHEDMQTYIHEDIQTCRHTDTKTYIQTYMKTYRREDMQTWSYADIEACRQTLCVVDEYR